MASSRFRTLPVPTGRCAWRIQSGQRLRSDSSISHILELVGEIEIPQAQHDGLSGALRLIQSSNGQALSKLAFVLLPVEHVVIVYGDFGRQDQAACFANYGFLANFPMSAGLAFTNLRARSRFSYPLESPEFFFHFSNKIGELRFSDDIRLPAEIAFNQVVLFHDPGAGNLVSLSVRVAAHQPDVIGH